MMDQPPNYAKFECYFVSFSVISPIKSLKLWASQQELDLNLVMTFLNVA